MPVVYRDLAATSLSHVSAPLLQVMRGQWDNTLPMNAELRAEVLQAQLLLQEFLDADAVVLGAPMYNFGMPSRLKSWLDRVLQAGRTVNVNDTQAYSQLKNKRVIVVTSACSHQDVVQHQKLLNSHELHLRAVFSSMGINDIKVIRTTDWDGTVETFGEWCEDRLEAA